MRVSLPNCHLCGKFVGWQKGYVSYTPYGSTLDLEPPDEEFMHLSCYEALNETRKNYYTTKYVWCPAIVHQPEVV